MQASTTTINQSTTEKISPRSASLGLVNKVRKHIWGYSTYGDMKTLFVSSKLRTSQVRHNLPAVVRSYISRKRSSTVLYYRLISLCNLTRQFNEILCLGHFNLVSVTTSYCMDSATQFFFCSFCSSQVNEKGDILY